MSMYRPEQICRARMLELASLIEQSDSRVPIFDMYTYGDETPCGTAGCIAGSAVYLWDQPTFIDYLNARARRHSVVESASRLLGLSVGQSYAVFCPDSLVLIQRHHAVAMLRWLADHQDAGYDAIEVQWTQLLDQWWDQLLEMQHV